jgi:hypothetical protein
MVMFNLDCRETDKPGLLLKDVQITTDSLVLGCMVRESVLWRFLKGTDESKFMVPIKLDIVQYVDGTLDSLMDAQRRLDAITCHMENVDHLWQLSGKLICNTFCILFDMIGFCASCKCVSLHKVISFWLKGSRFISIWNDGVLIAYKL